MPRQQPAGIRFECLETRCLFAWSSYAQLVDQDLAAASFANITGKNVTIAVIDTGIDYTQASLGGGIGANFKVLGGYDFVDNDLDPKDLDGHGTAVAAVLAANPYTVNGITHQGVAREAKLVALRAGTDDGIPNSNIEKSLQWIIANHSAYKITIVNLSLGSGNHIDPETDSQMSDEYATLRNLGIFVVAASGNSNDQQSGPISQDGVAYPAADPNVFAVGAVDSSDVISTWTQRGDELDLLGPGVDIVVPKPGGGFATLDGTSFASPHVAGAAALIKQAWSGAKPGDIGSILMSSGVNNRDGDSEIGNTTGLAFGRLDIDAALTLTSKRIGKTSTFNLGSTFDTAVDSQGVLHAAYYDSTNGDLKYATRSVAGLWSNATIVDSAGVVGSQLSIAVDTTGKAGIGYYDATNSGVKYASFSGTSWSATTVESSKTVGMYPSLGYDIDGNAYLAYYRKTSGDLKLARLDRDTGTWTRQTVDGADANVGAYLSLDIGEAPIRNGAFTFYDTTVAIAYADMTNGDLKYARLDFDDPGAAWFIAIVANTSGVSGIDLNLHEGLQNIGLQAQIAYRDTRAAAIRYAYRNTTWFVETVITSAKITGPVQLYFTPNNRPAIAFYNTSKQALYSGTRNSATSWTYARVAFGSGPASTTLNERTGDVLVTSLDRAKLSVVSSKLV